MNNIETFESIKHIDENGTHFWYARELMIILQYKQWRRFECVIEKAKLSCKNSGISSVEDFANVVKLSKRANNEKDLLTPKKTLKELEKENRKCNTNVIKT